VIRNCRLFGGNVAFPQLQDGETAVPSALIAKQSPPARTLNRSVAPRHQKPRVQSEAAEPAAQQTRVKPSVIAFIVLAVSVQGLWVAFLIWLAIRRLLLTLVKSNLRSPPQHAGQKHKTGGPRQHSPKQNRLKRTHPVASRTSCSLQGGLFRSINITMQNAICFSKVLSLSKKIRWK
jgi:hypothetical protein